MKNLPILSSMRATLHTIPTVNTQFGHISRPMYDAISQMDNLRLQTTLMELNTLKQFVEHQLQGSPQSSSFGEEHIPAWVLDLLDAPVQNVLSKVNNSELHYLRTTLVGTIVEYKNGKVVWKFFSNPNKTGYAYTNKDLQLREGETWLLLDSGKPKAQNMLVAGVKLDMDQAKQLTRALSAAWHLAQA